MGHVEYLELVSDKIRKGEPVGIAEAIAAIDYQAELRRGEDEVRAGKWWRRAIRYVFAWNRRTLERPE